MHYVGNKRHYSMKANDQKVYHAANCGEAEHLKGKDIEVYSYDTMGHYWKVDKLIDIQPNSAYEPFILLESGNSAIIRKYHPSDYEIIEASVIEWGLLHKGEGVRCWWKNAFKGKPTLDHPLVKQAIKLHEEYLNEVQSETNSLRK